MDGCVKIAKQNNVLGNPKQSLSYSGSSISVVSGYTPGEITLNRNGVIFPEYLRFQAHTLEAILGDPGAASWDERK